MLVLFLSAALFVNKLRPPLPPKALSARLTDLVPVKRVNKLTSAAPPTLARIWCYDKVLDGIAAGDSSVAGSSAEPTDPPQTT